MNKAVKKFFITSFLTLLLLFVFAELTVANREFLNANFQRNNLFEVFRFIALLGSGFLLAALNLTKSGLSGKANRMLQILNLFFWVLFFLFTLLIYKWTFLFPVEVAFWGVLLHKIIFIYK